MTQTTPTSNLRRTSRLAIAIAALVGCAPLSGCIVAGVSSGGGFFIWPGSLGLLVLILVIVFIARRR